MRFEYADNRLPMAMTSGGAVYYLAYDQVGSLRVVADSSGNIVKSIEYDSFGNVIADSNPAFIMPFGFAGGLHDKDTGLVRFGARDYDPDIGRWTAKDPILFAGGDTDLYGYCLSDPINAVDPYGLISFGDIVSGMATVATTAATRAGKITPAVAGYITVATAPLGDLLSPSPLNKNEDFELHMIEVEEEIRGYQQQIDEIRAILDPMLKKFHIDTEESPCSDK